MPKKTMIPGEVSVQRKYEGELTMEVRVKKIHVGGSWYRDYVELENDGNIYKLMTGDSLKLSLDVSDISRILGNLS